MPNGNLVRVDFFTALEFDQGDKILVRDQYGLTSAVSTAPKTSATTGSEFQSSCHQAGAFFDLL